MKPVALPPIITTPKRSALYDEDVLEQLHSDPGQWYLIETDLEKRPSLSWARQTIEGLRVSTRVNDKGLFDLYAMIEGE